MSTRNASWPGSWSDTEGMEKIETKYIPEIPGAILHFSARGLAVGTISTWYDLVNGTPWSAASQAASPMVIKDSQDNSVVTFDGVDDMLTMDLVLSQPHTVVVMGKFRSTKNSSLLIGGASGPANSIMVNSDSTAWAHYAGKMLPLDGVTPGTGIRTFISVSNGSNSVIAVGNDERVGDAGTNGRTFLRMGFGNGYESINAYEVAVIPYAASLAQRQEIRRMLFDAYGF